jgi:tetratricopeptide (TPR) repeat protein
MRVAGASVIAPIADAVDAVSPTPAAPPAPAPSSDEKGLEEFELKKAHIDWPTKSRRLRQLGTWGAVAIVIVLALRSLGEYMSERAAERDAEEQAALARGDLPDRWKDLHASASTTGTLEVVFAEGTPSTARDATTAGGDVEAADTSSGGDDTTGDDTTGDDTTGDDTTGGDTTSGDTTGDDTTGEPAEAVPVADETPPTEPTPAAPTPTSSPTGDPDKLAKQAASALKSGSRNRAISLYKQALAVNTRHVTSLIGLSDIYFDSGSYSAAARYLRRLTSVRPSTGKYRILLGDAYYKSGAYAKAVTQYERAVSLGVSGADRRLAKAQSKL